MIKHNIYKVLEKNKKKMLIRGLILSFLLFGINTYAWFIFFDKFNGNVSANVIGWDVTFFDGDETINSVSLDINNLYPGMTPFVKEILVSNSSDVQAMFTYDIKAFELFGVSYEIEDSTEFLEMLETELPFKIQFSKSKEQLNTGGDTSIFKVLVTWDFESPTEYCALNKYYEYNSSYTYYDSSYQIDSNVNDDNYLDKINNGLYMECDIADTYWGSKSADYKRITNEPLLKLELNLIVRQIR